MASFAESVTKRTLNELRVIDIKTQLELRGLEGTGFRASLIERLKKALEEEGHNPEEYLFEIDTKKESNAKDMENDEKSGDSLNHSDINTERDVVNVDNGDVIMATDEDKNVLKEQFEDDIMASSTPTKVSKTDGRQQLNSTEDGSELLHNTENKNITSTDDQLSQDNTISTEPESVNTTVEDQNIMTDSHETSHTENTTQDKKEGNITDIEASATTDNEHQQAAAAANELPSGETLEPPSPDSVPVVVPFTKEDLIQMDTSGERQVDEDISLIVHIDESQMELDNDLLNTPAKQSGGMMSKMEGESMPSSSQPTDESDSIKKPLDDAKSEEKVRVGGDIVGGGETRSPENEQKSVTSQSKDGDKAKSAENKADGKDDKGKSIPSSSRSLWISGLASSTRATDLKTLFSKYGKVAGAKVVTNAKSPGSRCYGFVTMTTADEASKCIQHLHRTELHGKMISVERAKGDPSAQAKTASKSGSVSSQKKEDSSRGERRDSLRERRSSGHRSSGRSHDRDHERHHSRRRSGHRSPGSVTSSRATRERDTKDRQSKDRKSSKDKDGKSKDKDILDFEKIKAERERERLKQRERQMREEERRRMRELERMRERQHDIERRQKEEAMRLEREKQKLRLEQQRLERERLEAERERIALERERQRRERENLEREREQERLQQLRLEQERRAVKRSYDGRVSGRDDDWNDTKRLNLDRNLRYGYGDGFIRRIERYDRRDGRPNEPPPRAPERFEGRRDDKHDMRRPPGPHRDNKDRDDRGRGADERNRNVRYPDRRDGPPGRDHDRPRHDRDRSPHTAGHANGPPHHGPPRASPLHRQPDSRADWKSERTAPVREGRGRGSRPGGLGHDWSGADRGGTTSTPNVSSRPTDRGWTGPPGQGTDRVNVRPQPAALAVQQPLLQTPPTSAAFLASAANIMMGVGLTGGRNSTQDTRYDAYKTIQGGNVGRY